MPGQRTHGSGLLFVAVATALSLVMLEIFVSHQIGLDHDADIGGVEIVVDNSTVTDKTTEPQIPFIRGGNSASARR